MPNAFAHIELTTTDLPKAKRFYKSIFGWKLTDMKGPAPYTMIDVGQGTGGGMQKQRMPNAPTGWMPYVQVDDVKKTVAKAAKGGAKVLLPFMEIGSNMGAIGVFVDPLGSMLGVWEAPKSTKKTAAKKGGAKKKSGAKKGGAKKAAAKTKTR